MLTTRNQFAFSWLKLFIGLFILIFIVFVSGCNNKETEAIHTDDDKDFVELRKFPYPYRAMLAISTDIDGTAFHEFEETHRFMNTFEDTKMGPGLGLDISNSFWMYVNTDKEGFIDAIETTTWDKQMSYFSKDWTQVHLADEIQKYIKAGWIDTIHSFGDFSLEDITESHFTREHAEKAIEELENNDLNIKVWVNHGNESNIQNFGGNYNFTEYQQGDDPEFPGYHTDLTIPYGIQFLWDSMGDHTLGYDSIIFPITLIDGQQVWGFRRFTHIYENDEMKWLWGVHFLNDQLSERNLNTLVENEQYSIIAQHLGNQIGDGVYPGSAIEALKRLKQYEDDGDILVARTSRLLEYNRNHDYLQFESKVNEDNVEIHISSINDPIFGNFIPDIEQLRGFTFYVDNPEKTKIFINEKLLPEEELIVNESDGYRTSISIKWFEKDTTDYTN